MSHNVEPSYIQTYISPSIDFKTTGTTTLFSPTTGLRFITLSMFIIYDTAVGVNANSSCNIGNNTPDFNNWNNGFTNPNSTTDTYFPIIANNNPYPVFTNALPAVLNILSGDTGTTAIGRIIITGYYVV